MSYVYKDNAKDRQKRIYFFSQKNRVEASTVIAKSLTNYRFFTLPPSLDAKIVTCDF